jgi:VWFA-related protein
MKSRRLMSASVLAACVTLAAWHTAAAPQPPPTAQPPVTGQPPVVTESAPPALFRTGTAGVRIDTLVTDDDRPVTGLTAADFELTDSGVAQVVEVTSVKDMPVDVICVLDISTSLGEEGMRHLIRATDTLIGGLKPEDRVALVTFSQVVTLRSPLTSDHGRVREIVRSMRIQGSTSVIDAAFAGAMLQTDTDRSAMLLIFSDGFDTASWLGPERVLTTIRRSPLVPYAIVIGDNVTETGEERTPIGGFPGGARPVPQDVFDPSERFLRNLVVTGGGVFMPAEDSRQLERRFNEALDSFRQRYVLTYAPQGTETTGWHPVTVKVKGHRYRIRSRPGYLMP